MEDVTDPASHKPLKKWTRALHCAALEKAAYGGGAAAANDGFTMTAFHTMRERRAKQRQAEAAQPPLIERPPRGGQQL